MKKVFIYRADNEIMDNLPFGIEILIIFGVKNYNSDNAVFSNIPLTVQKIYVPKRAKLMCDIDQMFPKLPFNCKIEYIHLCHEKNSVRGVKKMVYRHFKDDKIFKYPVMGFSRRWNKFVKVQFIKEYEVPEYKYSVSCESLAMQDIA